MLLEKIMNTEKIKERYAELYDIMSVSRDVSDMKLFGHVQKEMMNWFLENKPELAEEYVSRLEAVRWDNYLTRREAERIISEMKPKATWNYETWSNAMESLELKKEEMPLYNEFVLWVMMNKVHSDSSKTITEIKGNQITPQEMVKACYMLAVDMLKSEDCLFSVRDYYNL